MRKHNVDMEDPDTVNYDTIYAYVEKSTASEKAIQRMHTNGALNEKQKVELDELVGQFQAVTMVMKEKKLADLVVPPAVSTMLTTEKMMDKLTQSFEKLNISIGALIQQNLGQTQCPHSQYPYPRNPQAGPYVNEQNVRAAS